MGGDGLTISGSSRGSDVETEDGSMRVRLLGLAVAFGLSLLATSARAQDGFSDPFFLYYGYFLPRQNALASQGQPEDFYRNQGLQRQYAAQTDRSALYGDNGYLGQDELNPLSEFGKRSGSTRMVRTVPKGLRTTVSLKGHSAPPDQFQQTKSYFPGMRNGMGPRPQGAVSLNGGVGSVGRGGGGGMSPLVPGNGGMPSARGSMGR
jgi:hypothetical protein